MKRLRAAFIVLVAVVLAVAPAVAQAGVEWTKK